MAKNTEKNIDNIATNQNRSVLRLSCYFPSFAGELSVGRTVCCCLLLNFKPKLTSKKAEKLNNFLFFRNSISYIKFKWGNESESAKYS